MYQNLTLFRTAAAIADHAGQRLGAVAQNIANADTPGYRPRHLAPFEPDRAAGLSEQMRQTRDGHLAAPPAEAIFGARITQAEASPNGNSVSIERGDAEAAQISSQQQRALAVYRHGMTVLRTVIGR